MSTQWRVGMAGATGLDYLPLMRVLDVECVDQHGHPDRALWRDTFDAVCVIESAALEQMRLQAEKRQAK